MRTTTGLFLIDDMRMLAPDSNMEIFSEDILADSGRDESGFLHRVVARQGVSKWKFVYGDISWDEYAYMESLFAGKDTFTFTYPSEDGRQSLQTQAYRVSHSVQLGDTTTGALHNYVLEIAAC